LTSNGDMYVWGWNIDGMFNYDSEFYSIDSQIPRPMLYKAVKVKKMCLGPKFLLL
jgi:hypothetical protein